MNNRLAMCLLGSVELFLADLKPVPQRWEKLVARLRHLPEFVKAIDNSIQFRGRLVHRFTPAADYPPFPGAPDSLTGHWAVIVMVCGNECIAILGTQFHDGDRDYEWPADLPLGQLDPFMPLVNDLESFLGRLNVALMAMTAPGQDASEPPVLHMERLGVTAN